MSAIDFLEPLALLWIMVFSFGCASALSALEVFPRDLPTSIESRLAYCDGLAPFVARCTRGTALMALGLVGLFSPAGPELRVPLWIALYALSYNVFATARLPIPELGKTWIRVRRCSWIAAHATLGTSVVALVHGLLRQGRAGAFLIASSVVLLVAAKVNFVLKNATNELLALSGD